MTQAERFKERIDQEGANSLTDEQLRDLSWSLKNHSGDFVEPDDYPWKLVEEDGGKFHFADGSVFDSRFGLCLPPPLLHDENIEDL